ncbi:MacS family sensor histidine kinase [Motilibacter aurantiacus]|uniref:MacS family sensor histidine kinase n=1 Tax=Motilibacter aurantiacus TaxID=2714955 RepID=UPI00140B046D|nr:sensor histidine kinase [Motilibacter aurantiacus]
MATPARGAVDRPLWRTVAVFRACALAYAVVVLGREDSGYAHPTAAWLILAAMGVWTVLVSGLLSVPRLRSWPVLGLDLAVAVAALLSTRLVDTVQRIEAGEQTLPVVWPAAAVLAWALRWGWRGGLAAAAAVSVAGVVERGGEWPQQTAHNIVLLLLAGAVVGYAASLARAAEASLARALAVEAAGRERERLGRAVHDGVLQVLALVARRDSGLPGEAGELGRLAAEQEAALRALVSHRPVAAADSAAGSGEADLREALTAYTGPHVTVSEPATPVRLPAPAARELAAAVGAALDNVRKHAGDGARAYVLVEDLDEEVLVTVRDDGAGFDAARRLPEARAAGRMGIASSIQGRLADLGGEAVVSSWAGQGTEVELRLPRREQA